MLPKEARDGGILQMIDYELQWNSGSTQRSREH